MRTVDVYIVRNKSIYELDMPVTRAIEFFTQKLNEVPSEYRATARIDTDVDNDCSGATFSILYARPATPVEEARRIEAEEARQRDEEARARRQYDALRARFER